MSGDGPSPPKILRVEENPSRESVSKEVGAAPLIPVNVIPEAGAHKQDQATDQDIMLALDDLEDAQIEFIRVVGDDEYDEDVSMEERATVIALRAATIKRIPNFWRTVFVNLQDGSSRFKIPEKEMEPLSYLTGFKKVHRADGFRFTFRFNPNPYFQNEVIQKTFRLVGGTPYGSTIESSTSTPILWTGEDLSRWEGIPCCNNCQEEHWPGFFEWLANDSDTDQYNELSETVSEHLWINPIPYYQNVVVDTANPYNIVRAENEEDEDDPAPEKSRIIYAIPVTFWDLKKNSQNLA
ncbi:Protein SET [Orchesella cincta]|uniref:Protein SET n=1 Tax=Orchesella cincta TaxID=48709 RepID=A0A1D2N8P6_ORCCI|nr:Protein SET [Orchesella cincta]